MKASCSKNSGHKEFYTNATVSETWLVDASGNWQDTIEDGEVIDSPSSGNLWSCAATDIAVSSGMCDGVVIVED